MSRFAALGVPVVCGLPPLLLFGCGSLAVGAITGGVLGVFSLSAIAAVVGVGIGVAVAFVVSSVLSTTLYFSAAFIRLLKADLKHQEILAMGYQHNATLAAALGVGPARCWRGLLPSSG